MRSKTKCCSKRSIRLSKAAHTKATAEARALAKKGQVKKKTSKKKAAAKKAKPCIRCKKQ